MTIIDNPPAVRFSMTEVAIWIKFTKEWFIKRVVQRASVNPEKLVSRAVESVGNTHSTQITKIAAGGQDVVSHIGVVAGRAKQHDRCIDRRFNNLAGLA